MQTAIRRNEPNRPHIPSSNQNVKEREAQKTTRSALHLAQQAARTSDFRPRPLERGALAAGGGLDTSLGLESQGKKRPM